MIYCTWDTKCKKDKVCKVLQIPKNKDKESDDWMHELWLVDNLLRVSNNCARDPWIISIHGYDAPHSWCSRSMDTRLIHGLTGHFVEACHPWMGEQIHEWRDHRWVKWDYPWIGGSIHGCKLPIATVGESARDGTNARPRRIPSMIHRIAFHP